MSDFDVFLADCPARTTLEVVGHTWSVVVVVALGDGPLRYGELQDRIGGISNKMLTQTLARLRGNGLLTSADGCHELTALGRSLLTPVRALAAWAEEHTGDLLDARRDPDVPDGADGPDAGRQAGRPGERQGAPVARRRRAPAVQPQGGRQHAAGSRAAG
ncbi:winged helix-turn-helix transcriptional regulator [Saccharothrix texasensis]|uniref:HxlR family transcriptional regulator n=1 Tax=Saccharothrix texasensis TaxID=103734 RepID=A0A3N1GYK3_9PSEU|nr:helix-turn-helix domain-containing protein [Saccharothrix texasensis]ROP35354.1 HxlR family transcriptional regulator [Saccharothrix texasensis]